MSLAPAPAPETDRRRRRDETPVDRALDAAFGVGRGLRRLWARARSGQRPLVVVLLTAVVASVVMLSGPTERYLDSRSRVDGLRATAAALDTEIQTLERRVEALDDPRRIEALAREQQGMVRPGEVPYTLTPPEVDRPRIDPRVAAEAEADRSWLSQAWESVRAWF